MLARTWLALCKGAVMAFIKRPGLAGSAAGTLLVATLFLRSGAPTHRCPGRTASRNVPSRDSAKNHNPAHQKRILRRKGLGWHRASTLLGFNWKVNVLANRRNRKAEVWPHWQGWRWHYSGLANPHRPRMNAAVSGVFLREC